MAEGKIPEQVRQFIRERIDSAETLEILILLERAPERAWSADEVAKTVFTVPTAATKRLEGLVTDGLASSDGIAGASYRYEPRTDELRQQVAAVAAAYRTSRIDVIKLVFDRPPDPLRSFADAFKLRKE